MNSQDYKNFALPDCPGVYFFLGPKGQVLYVGKATSLKDRVKSYFGKDLLTTRGPLLVKMMDEAVTIEWRETDSVLEALIMEANQIKRHKPPHNTHNKDDKSYNYVILTKEDYPRLILRRGKELAISKEVKIGNYKLKIAKQFGPFPHGGELREALKIIRRIFPYSDDKCPGPGAKRPCFNYQIGLCPGSCAGVSKREYRKGIKRLSMFFDGKKTELIKEMERDMKVLAREQKFEEANKLKRQLYALEHIQDVALIKRDIERVEGDNVFRIEAYDVAHLSGKDVVGVMTVVEDGELAKSQYRKFKIKADKNDDTNNLKEVLSRRLNHPEWSMPSLIAVDGGVGHLNAANEVLKERGVSIPVVAVTKDERHKAREIIGAPELSSENSLTPSRPSRDGSPPPRIFSLTPALKREIILANSEAHRFAIGYHRKLRTKGFRI